MNKRKLSGERESLLVRECCSHKKTVGTQPSLLISLVLRISLSKTFLPQRDSLDSPWHTSNVE